MICFGVSGNTIQIKIRKKSMYTASGNSYSVAIQCPFGTVNLVASSSVRSDTVDYLLFSVLGSAKHLKNAAWRKFR